MQSNHNLNQIIISWICPSLEARVDDGRSRHCQLKASLTLARI